MPDTANHNIDTVIDGQLYIGKYAFFDIYSFPFRVAHTSTLVFPLQSPPTFADILASRILFLHVRIIPCKDPTT
jgi:hypothetical protein